MHASPHSVCVYSTCGSPKLPYEAKAYIAIDSRINIVTGCNEVRPLHSIWPSEHVTLVDEHGPERLVSLCHEQRLPIVAVTRAHIEQPRNPEIIPVHLALAWWYVMYGGIRKGKNNWCSITCRANSAGEVCAAGTRGTGCGRVCVESDEHRKTRLTVRKKVRVKTIKICVEVLASISRV